MCAVPKSSRKIRRSSCWKEEQFPLGLHLFNALPLPRPSYFRNLSPLFSPTKLLRFGIIPGGVNVRSTHTLAKMLDKEMNESSGLQEPGRQSADGHTQTISCWWSSFVDFYIPFFCFPSSFFVYACVDIFLISSFSAFFFALLSISSAFRSVVSIRPPNTSQPAMFIRSRPRSNSDASDLSESSDWSTASHSSTSSSSEAYLLAAIPAALRNSHVGSVASVRSLRRAGTSNVSTGARIVGQQATGNSVAGPSSYRSAEATTTAPVAAVTSSSNLAVPEVKCQSPEEAQLRPIDARMDVDAEELVGDSMQADEQGEEEERSEDFDADNLDLSFGQFDVIQLEIELNRRNRFDPDRLQVLNLSSNCLREIPTRLAKLKNLRSLDLSQNQLQRLDEPILALNRLETLIASNNRLNEQSLPKNFSCILSTRLKVLSLSGNQLQTIPEQVFELTCLRSLYLGANQIARVSRKIRHLNQLQNLYLGGNQLVNTNLPNRTKTCWLMTFLFSPPSHRKKSRTKLVCCQTCKPFRCVKIDSANFPRRLPIWPSWNHWPCIEMSWPPFHRKSSNCAVCTNWVCATIRWWFDLFATWSTIRPACLSWPDVVSKWTKWPPTNFSCPSNCCVTCERHSVVSIPNARASTLTIESNRSSLSTFVAFTDFRSCNTFARHAAAAATLPFRFRVRTMKMICPRVDFEECCSANCRFCRKTFLRHSSVESTPQGGVVVF